MTTSEKGHWMGAPQKANGASHKKMQPEPPKWFKKAMHYVGWTFTIAIVVSIGLIILIPLAKLVIFLFGWLF